MDKSATTLTGIYCRGCGYDLRGSSLRCPECGRAFDRARPETFDRLSRSVRIRRWVRRIALLLLLVTLPPALGLGWLWWEWRQEQKHLAALRQDGWVVLTWSRRYRWMPEPVAFLSDRVQWLEVRNGRLTAEQVNHLGAFPSLRMLSMHGPGITDESLAHLAGPIRIGLLDLTNTSVTGPGLKHLEAMTLVNLKLNGTPLDDNGLAVVGEMKALRCLQLSGTQVTDAGMKHVAELTELRWLDLHWTRVSDAGLEHLFGLRRLQTLGWQQSRITPNGAKRFFERNWASNP